MLRLVVATALSALVSGTALASVDIVNCGQSVPKGEDAILTTDLTCGSGLGVHLGANARLHLNGHTISGGTIGVYAHAGYNQIEGPGTISDASEVGIYAPNNEGRHKILVHGGVELTGHGIAAIGPGQGNRVMLVLKNVAIHDNPGSAVADCIGVKVVGTDLTVKDNGVGLCGDAISLLRSQVEHNASIGIFSWKGHVRLKDSTVTGNDTRNGWDIATTRKPKLLGVSSCGSSVVVEFGIAPTPASPSWGVCTND